MAPRERQYEKKKLHVPFREFNHNIVNLSNHEFALYITSQLSRLPEPARVQLMIRIIECLEEAMERHQKDTAIDDEHETQPPEGNV